MTEEKGLGIRVDTTISSKNEDVLDTVNIELSKDIPLKADKGYQSKKNAGQ